MSDRDVPARMWLWAAILVGAVLRVWGLWFGLPHAHARPDEAEAFSYAVRIAQGDLNPHFFHWPSLHLYIVALIVRVDAIVRHLAGSDGAAPTVSHLVLLGRAYVAVAGILTIPVVWRLARRAAGVRPAIGAALLLAVAPLHVRESHFALTDVTMTLLVAASLWLIVEAHAQLEEGATRQDAAGKRRGLHAMTAAGLVGGLATGTKYSAGVILMVAAASQFMLAASAPSRWRWSTWAPLPAFIAGSAAGFLAATPYAVLDFATFRADLLFDFAHLSGGHGPMLGRGWIRHLVFSLPLGLGIVAFIAACAGGFVALWRGGAPLRLIAVFVAVFYLAIGTGYTVFARYTLPLIPAGCVMAALAVDAVSRLRGRVTLVWALLLALVALPSLVSSVWLDVLLSRTDTRVLAARWLNERLPPDSTLFESGREYVTLELASPRLHRWRYDPATRHFAGATPDMLPEWIVLHRSPLNEYTPIPEPIETLARSRYVTVAEFAGTTSAAESGMYDQQDAFFLPLKGFRHILRPGPTITVYERRDLGPAAPRAR